MPSQALFLLPVIAIVFVGLVIQNGIHQVPEGHLGLYWRGGALLNTVTNPGYHLKIPWITATANVQYTLQTDVVKDIPCGTNIGVIIYFETIEVVNVLKKDKAHETIKRFGVNYDKVWIFDKIHHEINQFCSKHSLQEVYIDLFDSLDESLVSFLQASCDKYDTGVEIIAIRVTKPTIPKTVMHNYLSVAEEKTKLLLSSQQQHVLVKEEESKMLKAQAEARREAEVASINAGREANVAIINQQRETNVSIIRLLKEVKEKEAESQKALIQAINEAERYQIQIQSEANASRLTVGRLQREKEAEALREEISNRMYSERSKVAADALAYAIRVEAEAKKQQLTPEYLRLVLYQSLSNNTKIYFGESLPRIFQQWGPWSGLELK